MYCIRIFIYVYMHVDVPYRCKVMQDFYHQPDVWAACLTWPIHCVDALPVARPLMGRIKARRYRQQSLVVAATVKGG